MASSDLGNALQVAIAVMEAEMAAKITVRYNTVSTAGPQRRRCGWRSAALIVAWVAWLDLSHVIGAVDGAPGGSLGDLTGGIGQRHSGRLWQHCRCVKPFVV